MHITEKLVRRLAGRRDEGAIAVEYALLIALVGLVLAVGAVLLGTGLSERFKDTCVQVSYELANDCYGDGGGDVPADPNA